MEIYNISSKVSTIIDYFTILTLLIDEHKSTFSKFPMSSISMSYNYFFLNYNNFFWRVAFSNETVIFLKIKLGK